jgi:hypothetical protein
LTMKSANIHILRNQAKAYGPSSNIDRSSTGPEKAPLSQAREIV